MDQSKPNGHNALIQAEMRGGIALARVISDSISEAETIILRAELETQIAETPSAKLAIDLRRVRLLASAGIGMLIHLHKVAAGRGGGVAIFGVSPQVVDVLHLTRVDRLLKITPDEQAAIGALS